MYRSASPKTARRSSANAVAKLCPRTEQKSRAQPGRLAPPPLLMNRSTTDGRSVSAKARRDGTATSSAKRRAAGSDGGASPAALAERWEYRSKRSSHETTNRSYAPGWATASAPVAPICLALAGSSTTFAEAFRELIGVARIGDEKMDSISQLFTVPLLVGDFSLRRSDKNRTRTSRATIGPWIATRKPRSKKHTAVQARMNSGTRQFGRNGRISVRSAMPASTRAVRIVGPES